MMETEEIHSVHGCVTNTWVVGDGRCWPGLGLLWLWLRQCRPRDFPIITGEGTITAQVSDLSDPHVTIVSDIAVRDWSFDHRMLSGGGMRAEDVIEGLLLRRKATITFPDGHTVQDYIRTSGG